MSLREDIDRALGDAELRGALRRATDLFSTRRRAALSTVSDWEGLRSAARRIKDEALADLDRYLDEFVANVERRGVVVHRAADADAACRIVEGIVRAAGPDPTVVKSKSMTTEEIELNEFLEARGLHPVETDLGEWIIQLAGERPSHIIVPAIHKTRAQIAKLFTERLEAAPDLDEAALTAIARRFLREEFARADVGITGVNFAVAETGAILLLENEGNIRLSTSLPRVHVAVMGIEKVIPRLADLAVFLRLLPRSGTGQHLTSYQSILTGVAEGDGPEAMHVVLLDNGRSRMRADPITRQSLACIRCGACLNACPVYQQIGGHAYGSVYPGPIGSIITPQLDGVGASADDLPFASSLCGACVEVCPVRIDIPELLLHLRARPQRGGFRERVLFSLWSRLNASRAGFGLAAWGARLLQRTGLLRRLPPAQAWQRGRELRPFARRSFRDQWRAGLPRAMPVTVRASEASPVEPADLVAERGSVERFVELVESVGGRCHQVRGSLTDTLNELLAGLPDGAVAISDHAVLRDSLSTDRDVVAADAPRSELLDCAAGVTTAQWGIAETGTLVLAASQERYRLVSLLPRVHIAVLSTRNILATLDEALAAVGGLDDPAVTFVTGPSRTADIELTLVVGVHGPAELHVLLTDD